MPPVCSLHLQQNPTCGSSVLVPGTPSRGSPQPGIAKPRAAPLEMPPCPLTPHQATTQLCHRALLNPSCLEELPQVVLTTMELFHGTGTLQSLVSLLLSLPVR